MMVANYNLKSLADKCIQMKNYFSSIFFMSIALLNNQESNAESSENHKSPESAGVPADVANFQNNLECDEMEREDMDIENNFSSISDENFPNTTTSRKKQKYPPMERSKSTYRILPVIYEALSKGRQSRFSLICYILRKAAFSFDTAIVLPVCALCKGKWNPSTLGTVILCFCCLCTPAAGQPLNLTCVIPECSTTKQEGGGDESEYPIPYSGDEFECDLQWHCGYLVLLVCCILVVLGACFFIVGPCQRLAVGAVMEPVFDDVEPPLLQAIHDLPSSHDEYPLPDPSPRATIVDIPYNALSNSYPILMPIPCSEKPFSHQPTSNLDHHPDDGDYFSSFFCFQQPMQCQDHQDHVTSAVVLESEVFIFPRWREVTVVEGTQSVLVIQGNALKNVCAPVITEPVIGSREQFDSPQQIGESDPISDSRDESDLSVQTGRELDFSEESDEDLGLRLLHSQEQSHGQVIAQDSPKGRSAQSVLILQRVSNDYTGYLGHSMVLPNPRCATHLTVDVSEENAVATTGLHQDGLGAHGCLVNHDCQVGHYGLLPLPNVNVQAPPTPQATPTAPGEESSIVECYPCSFDGPSYKTFSSNGGT